MNDTKWIIVTTVITLCFLAACAGLMSYRTVGLAALASGVFSTVHIVVAYRCGRRGVDLNASPLPRSTHVPHGVSGPKRRE